MCDLENTGIHVLVSEQQFEEIITESSFLIMKPVYGRFNFFFKCKTRVGDGLSTLSDFHQASDDDGNESDNFCIGEDVLDPGAPLHISTVHKGQQAWEETQ